MYKQIKLVFIFLMVFAVLCGSTAAFSAETYKIGCIFPMTGTLASSGEYLRNGATQAMEKYNAAGGINGHMLELVIEDSKGVPRDGIMAFKKLLDVDNVAAVLPSISGVTVALIPEVNDNEVVMLNPMARAQDVVGAGPRIFSIVCSTKDDGVAQVRYAYDVLGARTAVMMYLKADTGVSYDQYMSPAFEEMGGKMLSREGHDGGTTDYRAVLTKIKQLNPDVIFIESMYQETASIIKQARELGITSQTMSYSTVLAAPFTEIAGSTANGHIISVSSFDPKDPRESTQEFVQKYEAAHGVSPIYDAAMAYDGVCLLAEAMKLGGYSPDGITEGLLKIKDFDGATGFIPAFREGTHDVDRAIGISQYKDGTWIPLVVQQ